MWIFASSLMNAAILGYFYGIWGASAHAGDYLSFLTGWKIIDSLRFEQGFESLHVFLNEHFGRVEILFDEAGSNIYSIAVVSFSAVVLLYSMLGHLHALLKTDVFQMNMFIEILLLLVI